ncbi:Putative epoxidase LasC [Bradyrhizobium ivorense]|uniref:Epoxidase LasC n=1 Tax=Bradyrhizobium ivorense TaxID=2511166 RepID=A0A508TB46_9BRAD|nr:FAD-dependent oxidoreductase [Bradyrhizobium ivorense]VIO71461.1 Putative epoxidase LasC [Bradyrhizobium ivorense]
MASTLIGKRAVVIGAGMAGLSAAGALADHFGQVVVLERDILPSEPAHRAGTPQARHSHALLFGGQRALSNLFPGFEQDLARAGAVPLRAGLDIRFERRGYDPFPQRDLGWVSYASSRPMIEHAVRQRVESRANIMLRQRCRVTEVLGSPNGGVVTGVGCDNGNGANETIGADLVVDASGRGAPTLALLQSMGCPPPEETTIGIDLAYATCIFAIPADASTDWKGVITVAQAPHERRGGIMLPLEANRWMATISGRHGDVPPGDADGFLAFAQSLRTPTIYNAIRQAEPLDGVARYGFPESAWRHFERLDFFPRGLLPIGDAICRFNPAFGQGMSVAALEARLLRELLERLGEDSDPIGRLAPAFFAEVPTLLETPWSVAMLDFAFPNTRGQRPADFETTLKFGDALIRLAAKDPAVHRLTLEVQQLLKPRSVYRDPTLVQRVLAEMAEA